MHVRENKCMYKLMHVREKQMYVQINACARKTNVYKLMHVREKHARYWLVAQLAELLHTNAKIAWEEEVRGDRTWALPTQKSWSFVSNTTPIFLHKCKW